MVESTMRTFRQRVLVTVVATVIAAACGTLVGYLVGRALTLRHAQAKLWPYANRILREAEGAAGEARAELATMNASPYAYCSDQEITWMRKLIFQSEFLKEGGRMRDGRIDCSATLGRPDRPGPQSQPDFSLPDGVRLYRNLTPFRIGNQTVVTIQMGDSYVVYSPYNFKGQGPASMHFTVTEVDVPSQRTGRLVGELPLAPASILTRDGQARLGDRLYATRCSARFNSCMTAYISIPEALQSSRGEFAAYIVISGLSGAIFGLVWSFFYRRAKSIDRQLRRAIGRDALQVVYQPIVELASRQIVGAEALARWTDEDNFAVGPDVFIRIAEDGGFVGTITELVVRHALRDFAETLRAHPDFRLSVNVAAADLHDPAFLPMMESLLARAEVPARSVSIEITETSTAAHEMARETICRLRDRGHSVHIDDFGTGYSSLSYLHDLAVDAIKIDRTFTRAIGTQAVTIAILPQILALAAALNLDVIVEGIETEQQADYFASSTQPVMAQGWLFGRPVAADPFHRLLAQNQQQVSMLVGAF